MSRLFSQNPWFSMWFYPKTTIRKIVHINPKYGVIYLSALYMLQNFFFFLNFWSLGLETHVFSLLIPVLLLAPIVGFAWMFFYGWILKLTGRLLGGTAPASHIRAALAWSRLPAIITLVMWLFLLGVDPDSVFIQYPEGLVALFVTLILALVQIWTFVLLIESIREIQRFTWFRSICNVLLAAMIYSVIVFLCMLILRFIYLI
jgi:hypothetical protein